MTMIVEPVRAPVDLAVVVNGFPRVSETFVLQELLDLERRGVRLHVFALMANEEAVRHEAVARLRAGVEYLPQVTPQARAIARRAAHGALLLRSPRRYLAGLAEIAMSPDFSRQRLYQAAVLGQRLVRLGSPPLYIHFAHKPATVGRFAALLTGVPYALSAHAKDIWLTPPEELAAKVRGARVVLTCTDEGRGHVAALAGDGTPVRRIYHGIDPGVASAGVARAGRPRILSVGRLVEKKGHATLLAAAALLRDRGLSFELRIAGEGVEWPRLQRLVHELGLADRVLFLGPLSQEEVHAEYARADVFALACVQLPNGDRDGLPNVVLEAMAHRLPVVSTTLAGVSEAVADGATGLLAASGDARELADALQRLLEDRDLRARLGNAGRARTLDRFDRHDNLPHVYAALAAAGIVAPPPRRDRHPEPARAAA